ncbi:endonuclease-reverse transcriptase [Apostichopus japonicus]|uniref:Endonuclease-reverse transcriptase n=1 Tax=Stichopus japonicus TaxID=307972 RepID=A0A2G8KKE1_STIJA|nr:endonuclease-reverse transcriptase [Apostichopus japonicus]
MESMLQDLDIASRKRGLKMKKTKVMADQSVKHKPIISNGTELEHVSEYIYLGQRFTLTERNQDNEIRRRIKAGWQAFGRYSHIMKGNLPLCLKRKVYDQCILPSMTYASETWTLTIKMERKLAAAQHNMERSMLNITYKDHKTNKWIREQTKVQDIMEVIKHRKWTWAGHVTRRGDGRWSTLTTVWTSLDGKRNRGRQRRDGEMKYRNSGMKPIGTHMQGRERVGDSMLRPSSSSGSTTAEEEEEEETFKKYQVSRIKSKR